VATVTKISHPIIRWRALLIRRNGSNLPPAISILTHPDPNKTSSQIDASFIIRGGPALPLPLLTFPPHSWSPAFGSAPSPPQLHLLTQRPLPLIPSHLRL